MTQKETMKLLAAQEAARTGEEGWTNPESPKDLPELLAEMGRQMKELNARQERVETHLVKMIPSAMEAERRFATIVLAGKELRDEVAKYSEGLKTEFGTQSAQVTATAGDIKQEFQYQLKILQSFFDAVMELSEKNEKMVTQCREMVATSSAIYNRGSAGVQEVAEKTKAHLKTSAETHRKEIEAQAQHFKLIYRKLMRLTVAGTIVLLLCAFAAGTAASAMWFVMRQEQTREMRR
jgi:hypothetical protein